MSGSCHLGLGVGAFRPAAAWLRQRLWEVHWNQTILWFLSIFLSIYFSIHLSIYLSIYLSTQPSALTFNGIMNDTRQVIRQHWWKHKQLTSVRTWSRMYLKLRFLLSPAQWDVSICYTCLNWSLSTLGFEKFKTRHSIHLIGTPAKVVSLHPR